jgi:Xaa-Pro dipeptidase
MNRLVESRMKPGVNWREMHLLAERLLLTELVKLGILKGDIAEMQENRVAYLFMPHGLGHFLVNIKS